MSFTTVKLKEDMICDEEICDMVSWRLDKRVILGGNTLFLYKDCDLDLWEKATTKTYNNPCCKTVKHPEKKVFWWWFLMQKYLISFVSCGYCENTKIHRLIGAKNESSIEKFLKKARQFFNKIRLHSMCRRPW